MKKFCMILGMACLPLTLHAADVDGDAAYAVLKKNDCFKCHALDKKKSGTPYKEVSKKYKGKADAEDKLHKHLTTGPKVKVDGEEEEHKIIKTKSDDELRNLVRWILAQ